MSILKKAVELFSPSDPELVEKTLARLAEQDTWNDVFSTKLIDILDNIDRLKAEIRQSSRATELRADHAAKTIDEAAARLKQACQIEEKATATLVEARLDLLSSETRLRAASESAEIAERLLANSRSLFRKAAFWAVAAVILSWIGLVWAVWFSLRSTLPVWLAWAATAALVFAGILISTRKTNEI